MALRLAVNPTRMELLRLRKRLVVAQRGHKLLKDKLDGLMKEFLSIAQEYKRFRLEVDEELPYVLKLFVLAEITSSRKITEQALESTKQDLQLTVKSRRIMSVVIPKVEVAFGAVSGMYSLVHTSPELDQPLTSQDTVLVELTPEEEGFFRCMGYAHGEKVVDTMRLKALYETFWSAMRDLHGLPFTGLAVREGKFIVQCNRP